MIEIKLKNQKSTMLINKSKIVYVCELPKNQCKVVLDGNVILIVEENISLFK